MSGRGYYPACHPVQSEGSRRLVREILRCTQDDKLGQDDRFGQDGKLGQDDVLGQDDRLSIVKE